MAEFLDTQGVSYYLKKLINNSNDKLYLISPYLQLNNQLKLSLEDRHKFSIDIVIIYGKVTDINPDDSEWLKSMPGIKLMFHKDLHAKCYFNEQEAIITSMNLYMFSQQNNVEMGIYISKEKDEELYKQIASEVDRIKRGSEHRTISVQKVEAIKPETKSASKPSQKQTGYCIRTGVEIPFNIDKPLSKEAYKKWNEYADPEYKEKYCHFSGEPSNGETSVSKPILKKNWKKAQEIHGFK
ncbi:MAG: phospholipase D family protein [Bacteroidota bacterium]|nr:MAG: phospholipase D family protein [Bacteroidota bacterium]